MTIIIDGKILADKIYTEIINGIKVENNSDDNCVSKRPNLAIVLVGEREDSKIYVNIKQKRAKESGVDTHLYKLSENESEDNVLELIDYLNNDNDINGILVQLPLPKTLDTNLIISKLDSKKDVDGFHKDNLKDFIVTPPLFSVVNYILDSIKYDVSNKKIGIVAKPDPFGNNLARFLSERCNNIKIVNPNKENWLKEVNDFDVLITAVGQAHIIKSESIKRKSVVIDMGVIKKMGVICGDVDYEDVKNKVGYITAVPGGVGPLTVAFALKNTFDLWKNS